MHTRLLQQHPICCIGSAVVLLSFHTPHRSTCMLNHLCLCMQGIFLPSTSVLPRMDACVCRPQEQPARLGAMFCSEPTHVHTCACSMFEARLTQGNLLKKLVDALKELVVEVNFDVNSAGISLQAMDSSHVCLVAFHLYADGFDHFRCDRPLNMGIHIGNLAKVLKCAGGCLWTGLSSLG